MMDRRLFLFGLLSGVGLAPNGATAEASLPPGDDRPVTKQLARTLDKADAVFSQQRPQLHYNRQRQHGQPPPRQRRQRRRWPHWRHRRQ